MFSDFVKMNPICLIFLGSLCFSAALGTYDRYRVYRVWPKTLEQRYLLQSLEDNGKFDIWSMSKVSEMPTDIMVSPEDQELFSKIVRDAGLLPEIFIEDVQKRINKESVGDYIRAGMTWDQYYQLNDIYLWLDDMATVYERASVVLGGSTDENRDIKGLRIFNGEGKKNVFLEGGIHAREWITPATVTYIANEILTSNDTEFKKIADSFNWYIFPVFNPDGYQFTHTNNRLWRKTRTVYTSNCIGSDLNRNWNSKWNQAGTSFLCSSDTYAGTNAFSEKSSATMSAYIKSISSDLIAYISFHSYSQLLMVPYGYTKTHLGNYEDAVAIGNVAIEALAKRFGTKYSAAGNFGEVLYAASGLSTDWVKQEFNTSLVYTYELRDKGASGFLLPANQILPNNLEVVDSLTTMFQEAERRGIVTLV